MKRYAVVTAVLLAVTACQDSTSPRPVAAPPSGVNAALRSAKGDYIVVLKSDETNPDGSADALVKGHGGQLKHVYRKALKGFAVRNLSDAGVEALRRNPRVELVEPDAIVSIDGTQDPTPSWGLDRIDAASGLDQSYAYPNSGENVTAYILDTGINPSHSDFEGRIQSGADFIDGGAPDDCNGHGTHVAGTVGGESYGVAKGVTIVAVRVLNCQGNGTTSGVIAGIDWVRQNASGLSVANMSLGGGFSSSLNTAVASAVASGISFAVSAGNSNANACNASPASAASAITVGATTSSDSKASYSNYGTCVDINAPGSGITSAWVGGTTAAVTISGTSMASPHVAGAAALVLSANPGFSPAEVRDALVNAATNDAISGLTPDTPNKLLFVGTASGGGGGDEGGDGDGGSGGAVVAAGFSKSCTGFSCTVRSTSTGPVASTSWSFTDGVESSETSVTRTGLEPRTSYPFTLTVKDASNNSSSVSGSITCNPKKCQ